MAFKPLTAPFTAQTAEKGIKGGLLGDIAVIRKQLRPRSKRDAPVDVELHVNPVAIGAAALGGALALWLLQLKYARREVAVLETRYVDAWIRSPGTVADALPSGFDWTVPMPDKDFIRVAAVANMAKILFPGLGFITDEIIKPEKYVDYVPNDAKVDGWYEDQGKYETQYDARGTPHEVWIPNNVWVGFHVTGHCYRWGSTTVYGIEQRDGFKVGTLV